MLSLYRLLVRPQGIAPLFVASNRRTLLLTPVFSRNPIHWTPRHPGRPGSTPRSIRNSILIDDLENVVMHNQRALEPNDLLTCLIRLGEMVESQDSESSQRESPLFQILSEKIIADLNSFTLDQVVRVLGVAGRLEVECSSPLVQECCQKLAPRLEELDLNLLNSFSRALHQFRGTSALTGSLTSSSTKVFESQVEKLDRSEFKICFRALEFVVRVNLKGNKRDLVIDAARKLLPHVHPIYALGVIRVVAFERNDSLDPEDHKMHALLKDCLTIIARNISALGSSQVRDLMTAYSKINIFERELHDALWSLAPSWSLDEIKQLANLSRAKDAFSSKDAETLRILLEARDGEKTDEKDTAETITGEQFSFLIRSIDLCESRGQLLDLITHDLLSMNSKLLFSCICRYRDLAMIEKGGIAAVDDPFFEELASTAASKLESLNFHQCTVLLKIAKQLKLDASHVLVQRVLREIPPLIPHMDLDQIIVLSYRMRRIKGKSSLKDDCLLTALLAFERQVKEKLDRTNEKQCLSALQLTLREVSKFDVQDFVIDAAQGFLNQSAPITAAEMIYSLAFDKSYFVPVRNPKVRNLAENCLTTIAKNLNKFDQKTVSRIMTAYERIDISSEELNDAFWARSASLPAYEAMTWFLNLPTRKTRLKDAEHLKELLVANNDKVRDVDVVKCAHLMALLALSSPGLHSELGEIGLLLAKALSQPDFRIKRAPMLVTFVTDLVVLGVFPEQELDSLFSEKNQRKILSKTPESAYTLIRLERLLRLRFGESCGYAVIPELGKKRATPRILPLSIDQELVDSVRNGLGGDQFFARDVITPIGSVADLVVAKSSDGQFTAMSGKKSLEDLAHGTRVVGLLQSFEDDYHDDRKTRKLILLQEEYYLRMQNICPVVINMVEWKSLPSGEKVAFVMRKIEDAMREAPPYTQERVWKSV